MNKIYFFVFLAIIFWGCDSNEIKKELKDGVLYVHNPEHGLWQNKSKSPIKFELEQTFGKKNDPIEELFTRITDVFTDTDQNIYILDEGANRLASFNANGGFLWSKEKKGQGPGEFERIKGMAFDGQQTIYLCSSSGQQIDKFNLKGEYQNRYYLANLNMGRVNLNGFLKPNILVVSRTESHKSGVFIFLVEIDETLKAKAKIEIFEDIGMTYFSTGMKINVHDEKIRVANIDRYEFKYYNIEGKLTQTITRDFHKIVRPGFWITDDWAMIRYFSSLYPPLSLFNEYEISFSSWPTNLSDPDEFVLLSHNKKAPELKFMNMFDLINSEGELLYSIYDTDFSKIGHPIHVDQHGKLYTLIYEPFPQVHRYHIDINE